MRLADAAFRKIFDEGPLGMAIVGLDFSLVEVNQRLCDMLGYAAEELSGCKFPEITHPKDVELDVELAGRVFAGEIPHYSIEKRYLRKDGSFFWARLTASVVRGEGKGEVIYGLAMVEDIMQRKRAELNLVQSDRLAAVGRLASGIAHEINNPLAYVTANLEFVVDQLRSAAPAPARLDFVELQEVLAEARHGAEKIRQVVRGLRSFARADHSQPMIVDLEQAVEQAIGVAYNQIRHRARLVKDYTDVPPVLADLGQLTHVFVSLLLNAADSLPAGGSARNSIHVATGTDEAGNGFVTVRDTGLGIDEALVPHLFDPFFTTKPVGAGAGLGLSVAYGIVTGLGGDIAVETAPGDGTTFTVTLCPADVARTNESSKPVRKVAHADQRQGRILVVDDDEHVAAAVGRMLAGHEVVIATNSREAIEMISLPARFDVIVCDLMMPEVSGSELYRELRNSDPDYAERIVFVTGGPFTDETQRFLDEVPCQRLEKPFTAATLRAVVRGMLR